METFFLALSKYLMIMFMLIYTGMCFRAAGAKTKQKIKEIYNSQNIMIFLLHFMGYLIIYIHVQEQKIINLYGYQLIYFLVVMVLFPIMYQNLNRLLLSNMCMFSAIGFVVIGRLDYDKCLKQFYIIAVSTSLTILIPLFISKISAIEKLTYLYGILGISMLLVVLVGGSRVFGAKLNVSVGGMTFQPSEFAKIFFIFFVAGMLAESARFKHIVITTICAALYVIILVLSKDLGGALIFFVVYLFMLYAATSNFVYLFLGLASGTGASVLAYKLFDHVKVRVNAFKNPWKNIDSDGYQVTQSLFAISAGGWLGTGLYNGSPNKVPVVVKDFIFSAIAEEFGAIFSMLLIITCMSCFIAFIRTSVIQTNKFYKMIAYGFGIAYMMQVFLTIGGSLKMIPSTGVTLPLISYGGSSALSTIFIFSIIQGITVLARNEADESAMDEEDVNVDYSVFDDEKELYKKSKKNVEKIRKNTENFNHKISSKNMSEKQMTNKRVNSGNAGNANGGNSSNRWNKYQNTGSSSQRKSSNTSKNSQGRRNDVPKGKKYITKDEFRKQINKKN